MIKLFYPPPSEGQKEVLNQVNSLFAEKLDLINVSGSSAGKKGGPYSPVDSEILLKGPKGVMIEMKVYWQENGYYNQKQAEKDIWDNLEKEAAVQPWFAVGLFVMAAVALLGWIRFFQERVS